MKDPRSKLTGGTLTLRKTEHAYLHLERMKEELLAFVENIYLRPHMRNFVVDYIKNLRPRAVTRDLSWGIPVPGLENKVFYVWFDAPIGYISGTMDWAASIGDPEAWKKFWLDDQVTYTQFIGKDNTSFHAVIFPAMEMGQTIPYKKVDALVTSEFLLLEGFQFSKSEGNFRDMDAFLETYSLDKLRYVLAAIAPETSDSEFSFQEFKTRCNSELVGKFGNFVNRVLAFAVKNDCTELSNPQLEQKDLEFIAEAQALVKEAANHYQQYSLRKASSTLMELAALGNGYFNDQAPWKLAKEGNRNRVQAILFCACYCQKLLALISYPIMPETALKIWEMISPRSLDLTSQDPDRLQSLWTEAFFDYSKEAFSLKEPELLFTIVE